jgi:hypothetical protein
MREVYKKREVNEMTLSDIFDLKSLKWPLLVIIYAH